MQINNNHVSCKFPAIAEIVLLKAKECVAGQVVNMV